MLGDMAPWEDRDCFFPRAEAGLFTLFSIIIKDNVPCQTKVLADLLTAISRVRILQLRVFFSCDANAPHVQHLPGFASPHPGDLAG